MKKRYSIIWEKWRDPFGADDEDDQEIDQPVVSKQPDDDETYDPYDCDLPQHQVDSKEIKCRMLITPMGVIPYNEFTASGKIFNFWVGHANFTITDDIVDIIKQTDGIESLDVFTRYRFRIAIGKAFSDSETMRKINTNIYGFLQ